MNPTLLLGFLQIFLGNNPTVEVAEAFLPEIVTAIAAVKAGTAFAVTFPVPVDGKPGKANFSWAPDA